MTTSTAAFVHPSAPPIDPAQARRLALELACKVCPLEQSHRIVAAAREFEMYLSEVRR